MQPLAVCCTYLSKGVVTPSQQRAGGQRDGMGFSCRDRSHALQCWHTHRHVAIHGVVQTELAVPIPSPRIHLPAIAERERKVHAGHNGLHAFRQLDRQRQRRVGKLLLSQLDGELQNGRIEHDRFDEMERSGLDRIAEIEKDLAARRQQLPKDTTENRSGEPSP